MVVVYEQRFAEDTVIEYSPITSCMTVTCRLPHDRFMGVHFTIMYSRHMEGILRQMNVRLAGRQIESIYIAGAFFYWGSVEIVEAFRIQNAVKTFNARLNPTRAPCFMLDLDGGGERPRFSIVGGEVVVTNESTATDITDSFAGLW